MSYGMTYSAFEAHYAQQNQWRRASKYLSDMDSDAGSDGLAVNSTNGSGRSGDWVPPLASKRVSKRTKSTDSGFSSNKTDSGCSFSDFSAPNSIQRKCDAQNIRISDINDTKEFNFQPQHSLRRSNSCNVLRHKPTPACPDVQRIEIMQRDILEQCVAYEQQKNSTNNPAVVDCRQPSVYSSQKAIYMNATTSQSSIEHKSSPFKMIRKGLRKITKDKQKNKELKTNITSDMSLMEYRHVTEENSDKILSRLATSPKKPFIKKIFGRLGGRTYSAQNLETRNTFERCTSMRSIYESAASEQQHKQQANVTTLTRANSMPSINSKHCPPIQTYLLASPPPAEPQLHQKLKKMNLSSSGSTTNIDNSHINPATGKPYFFDPEVAYAPYLPPKRAPSHHRSTSRLPPPNYSYYPPYNMQHNMQHGMQHMDNMQHMMMPQYYVPYNPHQHHPEFNHHHPQYYIDPRMQPCPCCHANPINHYDRPIQRETVVAPLSVKKENEKVAERRKVADVVFDTFV